MKVDVLNQNGEKVKELTLSSAFDTKIKEQALTLYVNYLRAALRNPIANTKDRGEVSGGGKKPWKQKGTGRARHGSSRSPIWVGGGVTFGPTNERNFRLRINKSLKRQAILSVISELASKKQMIVLDNLSMPEVKTKAANELLAKLGLNGKISLLLNDKDKNAYLSFRNLAGLHLGLPGKINLLQLISSDNLVLSEDSIKEIEEIYKK